MTPSTFPVALWRRSRRPSLPPVWCGAPFCAPGRGLDRAVLEYVPNTYGTQDDGKPETDYHLIGSGQAVVFIDGGATTASWSKAADGAPTYLLDSAGKPVSLNRGSTWHEIAPTGAAVSY